MVGADALLRRQVAEHLAGLIVRSAQRQAPFLVGGSMVVRGIARVDPLRPTFSAACYYDFVRSTDSLRNLHETSGLGLYSAVVFGTPGARVVAPACPRMLRRGSIG
jgi:hypothetical protein